jgi:hypothetical protein
MKNLKSILMASFLTVGIFSTALFTSCNQDKCKDTVCNNGGTCNETDGSCNCPVGYEGSNCETLSRTKFLGVFSGNETCTLGTDTYAITCSANADDLKFNIQNLYNQSLTAIASANGNAFTIPNQTVGASITASGSGTITGNNITVTYTISDGVTSNTCTFTGTK